MNDIDSGPIDVQVQHPHWLLRLLCRPISIGILLFAILLGFLYANLFWSPPLRISKETTYITEPLTSDGTRVDYFAALEKDCYPPEMKTDDNGYRILVRASVLTRTARKNEATSRPTLNFVPRRHMRSWVSILRLHEIDLYRTVRFPVGIRKPCRPCRRAGWETGKQVLLTLDADRSPDDGTVDQAAWAGRRIARRGRAQVSLLHSNDSLKRIDRLRHDRI